ncbi:hypothetical protein [Halomarina pelagica]|uniref:hypothetical protein n=1 Tax=Halomarina pelagica TaxID=2961599 RepID=UPI0020C563C7|nr:hypothetical protein [Halomarina sp. BND7]
MLPLVPVAAIAATALGAGAVGHHVSKRRNASDSQTGQEGESEVEFKIDSNIAYFFDDDLYVPNDVLEDAAEELGVDPKLVKNGKRAAVSVPVAKQLASMVADVGTDNHVQAGVAERIHAKELARMLGGEAVFDSSSVYAPDEGVDAVIKTADAEFKLQVKHLAEQVGDATAKEYADIVDYLASTNGFKESVDPAAHGLQGFSKADWSWRGRTELRGHQFINGLRELYATALSGLGWLNRHARTFARAARRFLSSMMKSVVGKATAATSWFLALSLGQQLAIIAALIALVAAGYFVYKWYQNRNPHTSAGSGTPSV